MKTLIRIACGFALVRAVTYVVRKQRMLRYSDYAPTDRATDAGPPVAEPIQPEDLNVAQNSPL